MPIKRKPYPKKGFSSQLRVSFTLESAGDFAVDEQNYQCTNDCDDEATEVETGYRTETDQTADETTNNSPYDTEDDSNDKTTAVITGHDPLGDNTRDEAENNP